MKIPKVSLQRVGRYKFYNGITGYNSMAPDNLSNRLIFLGGGILFDSDLFSQYAITQNLNPLT